MSKSGEGFLTQQGIEKMKSIMVNEIFKNEQFKLFELQTQARQDIKSEIEDILKDFNDKDMFNFNTTDLICKLNRLNIDMKNLKGKKVYGYLPKELKNQLMISLKNCIRFLQSSRYMINGLRLTT